MYFFVCHFCHFQCDKASHNINQTDVTCLLTCPIASTCSWRLIRASCRAGICALIEPREGCSPLQFSCLECISLRRFTKISAVYVLSGNDMLNADSMKTLLQGPVLGGFMESLSTAQGGSPELSSPAWEICPDPSAGV